MLRSTIRAYSRQVLLVSTPLQLFHSSHKAKYDDWKADPEKYADYVLDTDTTEVTVAAFMVEAKQKDLTSVNVLFSSPMTEEEVKDNIYVNYMVGDVAIKEQAIKGISMSADGLTATVEIYDYFVPKVTYRVTYTGMDYKQFEAATTNPEDVVAIDITTTTAKIYEDTTVKFNLLNKDGVVINQPADVSNLNSRVTFENSNELTSLIGDQLMIFNKGDNTTVTATYHTYDYDNSGNETVYTDSQIIVGTEDGDAVATSILAWTITTGEPKWDEVKHFIAAGDAGRNLYVQVVLNNNNDTKDNNFANPHMFRLTSSDSSILFTDEWGTLVPVKAGSVRVTVEYDEKFVGAFEVVVSAERKAARLSVENTYYANVSNSKDFELPWTDVQTVKVNLLDQYGDKLADNVAYAPNIYVRPLSAKAKDLDGDADFMGGTAFAFDPGLVEQGKYQYLFYDAAYPNLTGTVTFDVKAPVEPDEAKSYKVSFVGTSFDKNGNVDVVVKTEDDIEKTIEVQLMAYAKNGIKLGLVDLSGYELVVKDSKGKEIPEDAKGDPGEFYATWVSGGVIQKLATGRYTVDVMDGTKVVARGIFVVVDSQTLPTVSIKMLRSDATSADGAFDDCFTVKIGDDTIDIADMDPVFVTTSIPTRAYAKEVLVYKDIDGVATLVLRLLSLST